MLLLYAWLKEVIILIGFDCIIIIIIIVAELHFSLVLL